MPIPSISVAQSFPRYRQLDNKAGFIPVARKRPSEMAAHAVIGQHSSKALGFRRPSQGRSSMFLPFHYQVVVLAGPCDVDAPLVNRQRTVLGGVSREFVEKARRL